MRLHLKEKTLKNRKRKMHFSEFRDSFNTKKYSLKKEIEKNYYRRIEKVSFNSRNTKNFLRASFLFFFYCIKNLSQTFVFILTKLFIQ